MKISRSVQKQLQKLPPHEAISLINALQKYEDKQQGYIKWLEGRTGYRIKTGDYRVIFEFQDEHKEIVALKLMTHKTEQ